MKKTVMSFFVCVLLFVGCRGGEIAPVSDGVSPVAGSPTNDTVSDSIAKEMGEQMAEEMMGGVDIEFAEEGSGEVVPWPDAMPSDVPVFGYGKIDATEVSPPSTEGISIVVSLREVEEDAYDKYEKDLENAGWTITTDSAWADLHISAEKDGRTVDIDVDPMGENTAFLYYME